MLRQEFHPYLDGNYLMANRPVNPGEGRASDNGIMFSSIYMLILKQNNMLTMGDVLQYRVNLKECVINGELRRAPGDTTDDEVDDHYGVYAALSQMPEVEFQMPALPLRLARQPQLLYASMCAGDTRLCLMPLRPILASLTALIIATSGIGLDPGNSNDRQIPWLLIKATEKSLLCRLAAKIWFNRLFKTYGPNPMSVLFGIYYGPSGTGNNPYSKFVKEN